MSHKCFHILEFSFKKLILEHSIYLLTQLNRGCVPDNRPLIDNIAYVIFVIVKRAIAFVSFKENANFCLSK
jgi:hypothetical protein